jgi:hypothetical protein
MVDLDEWVGFYSWISEPQEIYVEITPTVEEKGIEELMSADLRRFCEEKRVQPRVKADIEILERAMSEGFQGRKLEKALYKVRHRDKVRLSKKRNRQRKKNRKIVRI